MVGCPHPFEIPSRSVRDEMYVTRHRGAGAPYDFVIGDFIVDGTWYDLDLSGIVPVGAVAVNMHCKTVANPAGPSSAWYVRPHGDLVTIGTCIGRTQTNVLPSGESFVIGLDADRSISYRLIIAGAIASLDVTVKGWWI